MTVRSVTTSSVEYAQVVTELPSFRRHVMNKKELDRIRENYAGLPVPGFVLAFFLPKKGAGEEQEVLK